MKWSFKFEMIGRVTKYIVKRYFGQYLEDFHLEGTNLDSAGYTGTCEDVKLNVQAFNEACKENNVPVEILDGSVKCISFNFPWTIFSDNSVIELEGLHLVVRPKERLEDVSMVDSMLSSMSSSKQLAEEYLKLEDFETEEVPPESKGIEEVARTIDTIIANLKINLHNTTLKIENLPGIGPSGVGLEIKIISAEYFDEMGVNLPRDIPKDKKEKLPMDSYIFKKVILNGVKFSTYEFTRQSRVFPDRLNVRSTSDSLNPTSFVAGSPEMPPPHSSLHMSKAEPELLQDDPILISKLGSALEFRLKMKQNESIIGPKMDIEINLGAFNLFLIPQQVHLLYELLQGLLKPSSDGDLNKNEHSSLTNKPMRPSDYELVEQELLRQQKTDMPSKSLKYQGWSSHSLDASDDEFQLMATENHFAAEPGNSILNDADSLCSSISSDTRSDCTGGSQKPRGRGSTVQAMLQDQMSEQSHFKLHCSSLCVIILHDDSVQESLSKRSNDGSKSASKHTMSFKQRAQTFFDELTEQKMTGLDFKDFSAVREPLSKLCATNHLRIMASNISLEGNQKSSSVQCVLNFFFLMKKFEVLECLFDSINSSNSNGAKYVSILSCENEAVDEINNTVPNFQLRYLQTEYTVQKIKPLANHLEIELGPLTCELDISLTDRIQTLLNLQNVGASTESRNKLMESDVTNFHVSAKTEISLSCPLLTVHLRFPIPDLRSVVDMDRVPWWQQNLHPEILTMEAKDITLKTVLDDNGHQAEYAVQWRDLHGLFKPGESEDPVSFLRVSVDPEVDEFTKDSGFDWPRLVIKLTKANSTADLEADIEIIDDMFFHSLSDALLSNMDSKPSPFFSTSVIYRSRHEADQSESASGSSAVPEEVIKPADKEVMCSFIEEVVSKSECLFDFSLPTVNVVFPSKDFFELLYNRLGNDLFLWKRTILSPKAYDPSSLRIHAPGLELNSMSMHDCNSDSLIFRPFTNESNLDSEDESAAFVTSKNYFSFSEMSEQHKQKSKKNDNSSAFTKTSILIKITKGNLSICAPVVSSSNEALPDVCGKLQLRVEDGQIFIASSYQNNENESYLCVLSEKSYLYHNGLQDTPSPSTVNPYRSSAPTDVSCIIYPSDKGMALKAYDVYRPSDMLKIAVQIQHDPKQQMKSFTVAIDISDATLRHYMQPSPQMWIQQLVDFLKVRDLPVKGYTPSSVVTEFHLNLANCAIDYRPFHLPLLSVVTVENFNMSCNISASTPSFLFRLISEEMRLFLSNKVEAKNINLRKNYVCVVDTGLIDISYRTSEDEKNETRRELYATNNIINVRTCSDSFKALIDLVCYLSASGDIEPSSPEESQDMSEATSYHDDSDSEKVHALMAEAMVDSQIGEPSVRGHENLDKKASDPVNTDEEFCILEDDPGVGLYPRNGEPTIKMFVDGPIKIVENHFSVPSGKSDILKAPKRYPKAVNTVALREMTLVWHMYGGSDFVAPSSKKGSRRKDRETGVTFSTSRPTEVVYNPYCFSGIVAVNDDGSGLSPLSDNKGTESMSWLQAGGRHRDHDVLVNLVLQKVKFQREVYPEGEEYASRFVMFIKDIKIEDRLQSSKINLMLYQFSNQQMPRQSNAEMVEIKSVYSRPDKKVDNQECSLYVSCRPLRLNIDQDSLLFVLSFFQDILDPKIENVGENLSRSPSDTNVLSPSSPHSPPENKSLDQETFYRYFSFSPELLIKIDYQGKHVSMEQGALTGMLMGIGNLNNAEIRLKPLCYRHGLKGFQRVVFYARDEWHQDIKKNQIPSICCGVGPMSSLVDLCQGIKNFFYMPIDQYRRDGQIVRGFQRGASALSTSTVMAVLNLTTGFFGLIQGAATFSYDMFSSGPSTYQRSRESYRQKSQPVDMREGLAFAANIVKEGVADVSRDMILAAAAEHEHKGMPGAIGGILRQTPKAVVTPLIYGSQAINCVINGFRHQIMPDAHQEDIHKWRTSDS